MKMLKPSARSLAVVSLLLWACSLALTGFTTSGSVETWRGYEILAVGWLGILDSCVAWFANPCLLWAGNGILRGRRAGTSACFAVLLACDSALLTHITVDEGGHTVPVDACGWGAVLWGLSTAVMLAAAGTRARELGPGADKANRAGLLRPLGWALSVVVVVLPVGAHIYDGSIGNAQQRAVLNRVAFSRVAVCRVPDPMVAAPLAGLRGPLEVRMSGDRTRSRGIVPSSCSSGAFRWSATSIATIHCSSPPSVQTSYPSRLQVQPSLYWKRRHIWTMEAPSSEAGQARL